MPLAGLLAEFEDALNFGGAVIANAHVLDAAGNHVNPAEIRAFMTEAAIVRVYVAWERFLEESFLQYLIGTPSTSGKTVQCYLIPPTIGHARRVVIGTQKYVEWGNPDIVIRLADLYFKNGEPFRSAIAAIHGDLLDLRAIRNAAAHISTTTSAKLDQVALRRLQRAATGVTVYELVTAMDPNSLTQTIFQTYSAQLSAAAAIIAAA